MAGIRHDTLNLKVGQAVTINWSGTRVNGTFEGKVNDWYHIRITYGGQVFTAAVPKRDVWFNGLEWAKERANE